jgi:hypothetical protein
MNPVDEFLVDQGLIKESDIGTWATQHPVAASALTAAVVPLAGMATQEAYQEVKGMVGRARGYQKMLKYNPAIGKMDAKKTKALFNTLHNAAPDLAKDPVVASSWVNRMAYQDEYVDPRTLSDLGAAQQRIAKGGIDFPLSSVTSSMVSQVGGMAEQARRAEDSALNKRKFDYQKARDAVSIAKDDATIRREKVQRAKTLLETKELLAKRKERLGQQQGAMTAAQAAFRQKPSSTS